jgi:hypothetical protein
MFLVEAVKTNPDVTSESFNSIESNLLISIDNVRACSPHCLIRHTALGIQLDRESPLFKCKV